MKDGMDTLWHALQVIAVASCFGFILYLGTSALLRSGPKPSGEALDTIDVVQVAGDLCFVVATKGDAMAMVPVDCSYLKADAK